MIVKIPSSLTSTMYSGEEKLVTGLVYNDNLVCTFTKCSCETSQGLECKVGYPVRRTMSKDIKFYVEAPSKCCSPEIVTVDIKCEEESGVPGFCLFPESNYDKRQVSFNYNWCGDNKCNTGKESCSSCSKDCGKCDGEPCNEARECSGGYCVHRVCSSTPYIIGDGFCDPGENCANSDDCSCKNGEHCEPSKKICVECYADSHCDNTPRVETSKRCSGNNEKLLTSSVKEYEKCNMVSNSCELKKDYFNDEQYCGERLCQNKHCGCDSGYFPCKPLQECVKSHNLKPNSVCGCDFQCVDNICEGGRCVKGLVTEFKTSKKILKPEEEAQVSLSISNQFDLEIGVDASINLGSSTSAFYIVGQDCSSTQCKIATNIPAHAREEITIKLVGNEIGKATLESVVKYNYKGRDLTIPGQIIITFTKCGEEDCTPAIVKGYEALKEKSVEISGQNIPFTVIIAAATLLILGSITFLFYNKRKSIYNLAKAMKPDFSKSKADELEKLSKLKEQKIITKREFQKMKRKIVHGGKR